MAVNGGDDLTIHSFLITRKSMTASRRRATLPSAPSVKFSMTHGVRLFAGSPVEERKKLAHAASKEGSIRERSLPLPVEFRAG